jgi:hypothetical protein
MILLERVHNVRRGWAHVLSSTDDRAELERFRHRIGAPKSAMQSRRPTAPHWHLDVCGGPRLHALRLGPPEVAIYETTMDLMRAWRAMQQPVREEG